MRVDRERLRPTVAPGPLLLVVLDEIILDGDWEPWLLCVLAGGLLAAVVGVRRAAAGIGGFLLLGVDMLKAIGIIVAGACFCYCCGRRFRCFLGYHMEAHARRPR